MGFFDIGDTDDRVRVITSIQHRSLGQLQAKTMIHDYLLPIIIIP